MEEKFKTCDDVLKQLVAARREEVVRLQKSQAEQIKDLDARGKARLAALRKILPRDTVAIMDKLDKTHHEAQAATKSQVDTIKARLADSGPAPENETAAHPGLANGQLIAPGSLGWFTPYYGILHGSDGSVYGQGYYPYPFPGNSGGRIILSVAAYGGGSGIFGTGAGSFTVYLDWWFSYVSRDYRYFGQTIWVPYHGFYIVRSDDGFWDSKEAHVRMDLSAVGYQYNYKSSGTTNVLNIDSQNIDVNGRVDGWRTMYYSDLLGADRAYLRVTASFYVYARGGGSYAELNFSAGTANYMGMPWVYVA